MTRNHDRSIGESMTRESFSISELSKEFGVTPRTIRFYEDQGLLSPTRNGQHRIYTQGDRVRLKLVIRGKRLGFSLAESRELIDMYDPSSSNTRQLETMLGKLEESKRRLQQQMKDIKAMQKELNDAEQRCLEALDKNS